MDNFIVSNPVIRSPRLIVFLCNPLPFYLFVIKITSMFEITFSRGKIMKYNISLDMKPCKLVEVYRCFEGTSAKFYQTTWRNVLENCTLQYYTSFLIVLEQSTRCERDKTEKRRPNIIKDVKILCYQYGYVRICSLIVIFLDLM
jgi:hypothetical protein